MEEVEAFENGALLALGTEEVRIIDVDPSERVEAVVEEFEKPVLL